MIPTGLDQFLSPDQIKIDPASLTFYGKDWTKHLTPKPAAIVFPKSTQEVQDLVRWARAHRVGLVPSGGRTGLSGAATALAGEVVVSFEKMNRILDFDRFGQMVTIEPGVVTEHLQNFAKEQGLYYPVDFAARGSSQMGGNIATNAGGIKVLKYGMTRNWVTGLRVVTGAGERMDLNRGLIKNATGYDFRHLFIGSEGTLGFIVEASIALTRPPGETLLFCFGLDGLPAVMNVFHAYRSQFEVLAFEMFTEISLKHVVHHTGLAKPLGADCHYYVLLEIEATAADDLDKALALFEAKMQEGVIRDGILSQSPSQARDLWRLREDITESTSPFQPYKNDISVRISKVPEFLDEMDGILRSEYPDTEVVWFGHIGDGNLHVNILKPSELSSEKFLARCHRVDNKLFAMIEKHGGSISAEHGVGVIKKPYLHHSRSEAEIQAMKSIKRVFDPDGIMNPGKIFD
jgi:FAD/FMN-containing dehydrogenase